MSNNGNSSLNKQPEIDHKEIEFPVSFELKAVMLVAENDNNNIAKLVKVFNQLGIDYEYQKKKLSSKGSYVSYTFGVTLSSKEKMDSMYVDLKKIKELKFAV